MGKLGSKSPRRPGDSPRSDWYRRASNHAGRSMKRTLHRRKPRPDRNQCREYWRSRPDRSLGKTIGVEEGLGTCTRSSSRRKGDGTYGRISDPKQGRSWRQPRSGRRARIRCISSDTVKSAGVSKIGGSGCSSEDGRDNRTPPEQRPRGPRWPLERPKVRPVDNTGAFVTDGHASGEGEVKPGRLEGYADLALYPVVIQGRSSLTDEARRFEAVLGKTRRTEF